MNNQYLSNIQADAINNLSPGEQNSGLGSKLQFALQSVVGLGTKFYLDATNGNDSNDGLSTVTAFKTLPIAYAALTANKNDVLYIIGGASSLNLAVAFTWAKSYTHLIGLCAGGAYGRARIGHSANFTTMFTITANGCIFQNIHWQMGRGSGTNINCVWLNEASNYNTFSNCHFDAPLHATEGTGAYRALVFGGTPATPIGARSNLFYDCVFGDWTAQPTSTSGALIEFLGVNAGTKFNRCDFVINTTQATLVPIICGTDIGGGNPPGYVIWDNCNFLALSTGVSVLCTAPTTGKFVFLRHKMFGVANMATTSGNVIMASGTAIDARYGGLGVSQA
jgi:hypothetical protein